jgi:DNA-directed RNA polymerase specialized sigma24 family protein
VAHNCVMDHFRRKPPLQLISLDDGAEEAMQVAGPQQEQPERAMARRQTARQLLRVLALLPDEQREVFLLHEEAGGDRRRHRGRQGNGEKPPAVRTCQTAPGIE